MKVKKIHHKLYAAYCKGKVEVVQKTIKNDFQGEAGQTGFSSLEELNTAFQAWVEMVYNLRLHTSTGQAAAGWGEMGIGGREMPVESGKKGLQ